jgi:ubiquinone/menaquinone biosynthesis C-methylase UbiE
MTWFDTKNGQRLLDLEEEILKEFLEDKFGYYALQINTIGRNLLKKSRMKHHVMIDGKNKNIVCSSKHMPFDSDSIDLTISQHFLEKNHDVSEFFNELYRITIPGGRIIIFSFNPFSFAGFRNLTYFDRKFPWNTQFISMRNVQSKLKDCGFTIEHGKILDYQPLFSDNSYFSKNLEEAGERWFPLFGNIYFISAKKEVPGVTPLRPKWNKIKPSKAVTSK